MAPGLRDLQLAQVAAADRRLPDNSSAAAELSDDLEDVRLLDSYEKQEENLGEIEKGMRRVQVSVSGMTCAACSNSVEAALRGVNGVLTASVALLQNRADVVFDSSLVKVFVFPSFWFLLSAIACDVRLAM